MVDQRELMGAPPPAPAWRLDTRRIATRLRRYLRSPKGYLLVALAGLCLVAAPFSGIGSSFSMLFWAALGSAGMEALLIRMSAGSWRFPSSALLTGLILGMILGPFEPWYVALGAGVIAADAKYLLRSGRGHIFNPAALGLVSVYLLFGSGQSWWGALPDLPAVAAVLLLVPCYVVAGRANKTPAALSFLAVYTGLFTIAAFAGDAAGVREIFRPPFVQAALYFAFFMVTDPPTSPVPFRDQVWFGVLVAVAAYTFYLLNGAVIYLPVAVLAGNLVYAVWRASSGLRPRPAAPSRKMEAA